VAGSVSAVGDNLDRTERDLSDHPRGDKLHAQILFVKGRFHWENGNYDEAASRLRDATGKDPTLAEAFAYLGYAITDGRGNHDEACAAFARYTTLAPGGPESGEVRRQSRGCR
jgi:Flp pilus assembly protein TadD